MAMTNYPYDTDFLKHLPGWPANTSCKSFDGVSIEDSNEDLFDAARRAAETYYNYDKKLDCNEIYGDSSSD